MKKLFFSASLLILSTVLITSCNDSDSMPQQSARLEVRLTDAPGDFDAVKIDLVDIQINVTGNDDKGWQSLPGVQKGIYNLLDLVNDKDTLLVNAFIPAGRVQQIRLILGPRNSIVVNGVESPLQTPSAQQSGLKLNIHQDVAAGILYTLLMDFDAARSVVHTGNGKYILKPVIRTVLKAAGGSIAGNVQPRSFRTAVFAIQGTDTLAGTFTDTIGNYQIRGLNAGAYSVGFLPTDTANYLGQTKVGVMVATGVVTKLDTVKLVHK
ncbi:DUF4382 domain-containing protein [Pseudoflavitalea sp. G-6-1-2]|uniref:DUF4382 domain-containing protein n=1 Tax=Pseudoflavitalea sp. G-6-1-2 TaxID=2728841 RepID=UPI00146A7BDF|nr:DUF4382 domain-containing protein [Pseudoflavitalea sp. G-6-1-2]NML21020.1 DUF4382 domain-containing protein [Pseudoflavitalea sp. G-6-1-2]